MADIIFLMAMIEKMWCVAQQFWMGLNLLFLLTYNWTRSLIQCQMLILVIKLTLINIVEEKWHIIVIITAIVIVIVIIQVHTKVFVIIFNIRIRFGLSLILIEINPLRQVMLSLSVIVLVIKYVIQFLMCL